MRMHPRLGQSLETGTKRKCTVRGVRGTGIWCRLILSSTDRRNMEDKKYIVSGEYLRQIREEVRDVAHMIQEQPLLPVIKNKMRKRLLKAEDMLFPDSPDSPNANLREHVCRCNHGRQDG